MKPITIGKDSMLIRSLSFWHLEEHLVNIKDTCALTRRVLLLYAIIITGSAIAAMTLGGMGMGAYVAITGNSIEINESLFLMCSATMGLLASILLGAMIFSVTVVAAAWWVSHLWRRYVLEPYRRRAVEKLYAYRMPKPEPTNFSRWLDAFRNKFCMPVHVESRRLQHEYEYRMIFDDQYNPAEDDADPGPREERL